MAQMPELDRELLLRAFARPSVGQAIQSGISGIKSGIDIGSSLAAQKAARQKQEFELMKQIKELTAQQALVSEAQTPLPTTRTIQDIVNTQTRAIPTREVPIDPDKPEYGTTYKPDTEQLDQVQAFAKAKGLEDAPETQTAMDILAPKSSFRTTTKQEVPLSPEEMKQAQEAKTTKLKGLAADVIPEKYAESLITGPKMTSAMRPVPIALELPNGDTAMGSFDPTKPAGEQYLLQDGTPAPQGSRRSYKYDIRQDSAGNYMIISGSSGQQVGALSAGATPVPVQSYGTIKNLNHRLVPPNDRSEIIKRIASIENDPSINNAKKLLPVFENVTDYVNTDNKVATDRLGGLVQKLVALDSGNLAAWEQRMPGSAQVLERIQAFYQLKVKDGTLSPNNKKSLLELLEIARTNLADNVNASAGMTIDSLARTYPYMDKDALYEMSGLGGLKKYIGGKESLEDIAKKYFGGGK